MTHRGEKDPVTVPKLPLSLKRKVPKLHSNYYVIGHTFGKRLKSPLFSRLLCFSFIYLLFVDFFQGLRKKM